jgi:hypothetical protein
MIVSFLVVKIEGMPKLINCVNAGCANQNCTKELPILIKFDKGACLPRYFMHFL